jgi:serine O-acetyltransferase
MSGKTMEKTDRSGALNALKADTWRLYGSYSLFKVIKGALRGRTFRVIVTMRLCQAIADSNSIMRLGLPFFIVLHHISTHTAGVDFPWKAEIGPGLALTHGWGLVVHHNARIGKNVTLFHGVTIGSRDRIARDSVRITEYPILEDEVWVGPHAIIIGSVTIGRGSRILGGAFVRESVPPYSIVQGNPSVVVKNDCVPDVSHPAPV